MEHMFIHVKKPGDALNLAKGSPVRSHVARQQWKSHNEQRLLAASSTAVRREEFLPIRVELDCSALQPKGGDPAIASSQEIVNPHSDFLSIPPLIGGFRVDPFRSYPIPWRPFIPPLVDHYLGTMAVDIPELDQPGNRGLLRTSWFPLVMTEPCLFLVIVLLAASNYASVHQTSMDLKLNLLSLRCEAVNSINRALDDRHGAVDDALVGAIAKMASYEAMFGDLDNYSVHMQGLRQVVGLRGGLPSLGLNGLLRRMVVWIDRNGAFLNGSSLYFPGATFAPGQPLPDPNPGHFLGAS
ncbi:hypothetical protein ASPWEDRAFT_167675 [Aspergillus wentii DTO 134E9]|uniref:Transcription factor domain-containing protein n=1 Tax=Aspergillus wentii DTO 134E9 TaxID=1073089 RepID=A0A1L9S3D0_ASPWE|nr:uncharacterized protein ASPWEDRAFT_167675 [Aspergillus wentii DTO 134E9]KAI9930009.1 hypothetical protein MW887_011819 [Aspergillus wentii]OJJ41668.1 hypothetical protein ASPWEDRAFT_167675 [Aspergillus wentii DTO 134E9]